MSNSFATPWTSPVACQAPLSMGFSKQERAAMSFSVPKYQLLEYLKIIAHLWESGSIFLFSTISPFFIKASCGSICSTDARISHQFSVSKWWQQITVITTTIITN